MKEVYLEIPAKKPEKIKKFYQTVLGWKYKQWDKEPYWMISTGKGKGMEGGVYLSEKMKGVVPTFQVSDLEAALKKAKKSGGKLFMMMDEGKHAYIKDPEGTIFGIWQM